MGYFKTFLEWWVNKNKTENQQEQQKHHRFDDILFDVKQPHKEQPHSDYTRKMPLHPQIHESIIKSVETYFHRQNILTPCEQNLKEAVNIINNGHFLSDEQKASSLLSLIGEEEAVLALRSFRWKDGVFCPICGSAKIKTIATNSALFRYICLSCQQAGRHAEFDDLTEYFDEYEMHSIRLWILIGYLRTFLPMSKIAKILGMSLEQIVRLINLMTPKESHNHILKKPKRSDSYFS
jgi:transposase-like protein